ncbi:MAG: YihY/virulence factor BrkB family protein [Deltaproteobacteria bacterium]|nr:YihY/virulence factor BrkB family protein [Deltaproteobacteria bacterium]
MNEKKDRSLILEITDKFMTDTCMSHAAALSFYVLLSIVPLIFVLFSIGSYIAGSTNKFFVYLVDLLRQVIPDISNDVINDMHSLLGKSNAIGIIGFIILFFSSDLAVLEAKRSLDVIFKRSKKSNPLFVKGKSLLFILFSGVIVSFIFILGPLFKFLIKLNLPILSSTFYILAVIVSSRIFSFFLIFGLFSTAYYKLPSRDIGIKYSLAAGALTTVLWTIVRVLFSWYMLHHSKLSIIYGSLSAVIATIIWVYYTALIFLISAEFVAVLKDRADKQ